MDLTPLERRQIEGGGVKPIIRGADPELARGDQVVVSWSRSRRHADPDDGFVFDILPEPVVWIRVTRVTRRRDGQWAVRFDIFDVRERGLYMAPGGGYTTNVRMAIDKAEVPLSEKDRKRISVESRALQAERQGQRRELRLRQERAVRAHLRDALDGLPLPAQQELLAGLERQIAAALQEKAA